MSLRVEGLTLAFDSVPVLDGIDLEVAEGEVVVLLGPSGCGKSTPVSYTHLRAHET